MDGRAAKLLEDGFVVLRGAVSPDECRRFLAEAVAPALESSRISAHDRSTWSDGAVLRGADGHPIARRSEDSRWPALFESETLVGFLDALHGGRAWRWADGAASGVGWIHLRFPVDEASQWAAPAADGGWHIDGATRSLATVQSVVVLPLVTPIRPGGGGTALIPGSHRQVGRWLHDVDDEAVASAQLRGCLSGIVRTALGREHGIIEATGDAGDVLVLHPLTVHAASSAHARTAVDGVPFAHGIRVTFNLSTNWASPPDLAQPASGREGSSPLAAWLRQCAAAADAAQDQPSNI